MGNADSNEAGTLRDGDAPAPGMPPSLFDAEGTIVTDLSCRRCSYNLRGLTNDRRCPECGTPVGLSTHGNLLRYADPDWVERLSRGGKLIMQALTAWVLTVIVMACGGIAAVPMLMELGASSMLGVLVRLLVTLWMMVVMAALYYGVWLITAPDPSRVGEDQYATSRRLTRIGVLAGAVQMVTHRLSELYIWSSGIGILLAVLTVITFVVLIVGVLAYLRYLQQLALRIPDEALSQRGRTLFWLLLVLVAAPRHACWSGRVRDGGDGLRSGVVGRDGRLRWAHDCWNVFDDALRTRSVPGLRTLAGQAPAGLLGTGKNRPRNLGSSPGRGQRDACH